MGISKSGKIAALTNYRDPELENNNKASRGDIVADYLINTESTEEYLTELTKSATNYNGFNLISGTVNQLYYRSEEHTSELQSRGHLVCRLLLEKKKKTQVAPLPIGTTQS